VRRVCHFFDRQAQRKQLTMHLETHGDIPAVWTDRVAAAVVLTNLLSNAIKYSPLGKAIHLTLEGDATGVTCAIQDEGPGLDTAEQALLFQRGVRLSPVWSNYLNSPFYRQLGVCVEMERKPGKYMLRILVVGIPERTQITLRHSL
jgi:sensor histidine kinase regulating citrate/malate metabolism